MSKLIRCQVIVASDLGLYCLLRSDCLNMMHNIKKCPLAIYKGKGWIMAYCIRDFFLCYAPYRFLLVFLDGHVPCFITFTHACLLIYIYNSYFIYLFIYFVMIQQWISCAIRGIRTRSVRIKIQCSKYSGTTYHTCPKI